MIEVVNSRSLPQNWVVKKLGDVYSFEYGKGLTKKARDPQGQIPVYGSNGVVGRHTSFLVEQPCLIVGRKGAAGKVHITSGPCWPIDTTYFVIPPEEVDLKFSFYLFQTLQLESLDRSTAIPGLNRNDAYSLEIPIPPVNEQRRIVKKIDELFTQLDAGVTALEQSRARIKRYRQAMLQAAITGHLSEEWRGTQQQGDNIPPGWDIIDTQQLAAIGTGATPLRSDSRYYDGGTIPWITSSALNNLYINQAEEYITDLAIRETNAKVFPSGTLLVAMYGEGKTRGKVSELAIDAATNQACAALVFSSEYLQYREYVKLFFQYNYDNIRRLSSGGVQPNLNLSIIKQTKIPLPPVDEGRYIVSEVGHRFSVADSLDLVLRQSLRYAGRLRQSILARAFSGRLL